MHVSSALKICFSSLKKCMVTARWILEQRFLNPLFTLLGWNWHLLIISHYTFGLFNRLFQTCINADGQLLYFSLAWLVSKYLPSKLKKLKEEIRFPKINLLQIKSAVHHCLTLLAPIRAFSELCWEIRGICMSLHWSPVAAGRRLWR